MVGVWSWCAGKGCQTPDCKLLRMRCLSVRHTVWQDRWALQATPQVMPCACTRVSHGPWKAAVPGTGHEKALHLGPQPTCSLVQERAKCSLAFPAPVCL